MGWKAGLKNFFSEIWRDTEEYLRRLVGHAIVIAVTAAFLKGTVLLLRYIFTERIPIIGFMEQASQVAVLAMLIILLGRDVIAFFLAMVKPGKRGRFHG